PKKNFALQSCSHLTPLTYTGGYNSVVKLKFLSLYVKTWKNAK
ncbi:MAG: hypothetical protein ACI9EH_001301, partial [Planktomarina sp.]